MYRTVLAVLMVLPCSVLFGQSPANPPVSKGDQSRAEAEVRRFLEDIVVEHLSKPDTKELERLYADEFTSTNRHCALSHRVDARSRVGTRRRDSYGLRRRPWRAP
jgi:hypothetical protein